MKRSRQMHHMIKAFTSAVRSERFCQTVVRRCQVTPPGVEDSGTDLKHQREGPSIAHNPGVAGSETIGRQPGTPL